MAGETFENQVAEKLKQKLAEQDKLRKKFDAASPADDYKDEITLGEQYRPVTEFRMDRIDFLVKHTPTELLNSWSVMTGPRRLRTSIEDWVDQINADFPSIKSRTE